MKKRTRLFISSLTLIGLSANAATDDGSAVTTADLTKTGYQYPSDLSVTSDKVTHTQLANYAWKLFIASMQGTSATITDGSKRETAIDNFITTGKTPLYNNGTNPLIFEALYHRSESYPYYSPLSAKPASQVLKAPQYLFKDVTVSSTSGKNNYVNLDETSQIGQNMLYFRYSNDPDFPMLYMAKVNDLEVTYAYNNNFVPGRTNSFVFDNETLEIKTGWRRISDIKHSDSNDYHWAKSTYYVTNTAGTIEIETDTFALVAIHIIQKTANYPYFIFTTFEHVNAVTRASNGTTIIDPAYKLQYTELNYDTDNQTASAVGAYSINDQNQSGGENEVTHNPLPIGGYVTATQNVAPKPAPASNQVSTNGYVNAVQPQTITKEVNDVNNQVRALIVAQDTNSIWANYRLKGVQAIPTSSELTLDYYLANIVVETSQPGVQLFRGGVVGPGAPNANGVFSNTRLGILLSGYLGGSGTNAASGVAGNISAPTYSTGEAVPTPKNLMGGCMGCHGNAQQVGQDFSFLASAAAGVGFDVDSIPAADMTDSQAATHNSKVKSKRVGAAVGN